MNYRRKLIEEELKTLDLRREDDEVEAARLEKKVSATRTHSELLRRTDMLHAFDEHRKYLVHEHCRAEQECEQLQRLIFEIQEEMNEKIDRLTKRLD